MIQALLALMSIGIPMDMAMQLAPSVPTTPPPYAEFPDNVKDAMERIVNATIEGILATGYPVFIELDPEAKTPHSFTEFGKVKTAVAVGTLVNDAIVYLVIREAGSVNGKELGRAKLNLNAGVGVLEEFSTTDPKLQTAFEELQALSVRLGESVEETAEAAA